ncbi:MAG: hypothetical protein ACLFQB_12480 [Chitinispirillaceae bacterium]
MSDRCDPHLVRHFEKVDRLDYGVGKRRIGNRCRGGDEIDMVVTITAENPLEFLKVELPFPSGMEVADPQKTSLPSGVAHAEYHKDRVMFFITSMSSGTHMFAFRMRALWPGTFSVLPARVEAMYNPGLNGKSSFERFRITR